jgi:hypothetical protein
MFEQFFKIISEKADGIVDRVGVSSYMLLILFNIIYFAGVIGIVFINGTYVNTFNVVVHSFLCLFLMYRFNPLQKNIVIKEYDKVIVFSSALFLLLNLGIVEAIKKEFPKWR